MHGKAMANYYWKSFKSWQEWQNQNECQKNFKNSIYKQYLKGQVEIYAVKSMEELEV